MGIVVAVRVRAWWAVAACVVAALAAALVVVNVNVPTCDPSEQKLSVLSANAEFSTLPPREVARQVAERDVDVLILIEVHNAYLDELMAFDEMKHLAHRSGVVPDVVSPDGTVILSRYPGKAFEVEQEAATFGQPGFELDVNGRAVLVRAIHPKPPIPEMIKDWHLGLREIGMWQRETGTTPLIMAGDFNASRAHPAFREASHRLDFAAGRIADATWPADRSFWPFVDIDHILTRKFAVGKYETIAFSQTDHRAVWADLALCER